MLSVKTFIFNSIQVNTYVVYNEKKNVSSSMPAIWNRMKTNRF